MAAVADAPLAHLEAGFSLEILDRNDPRILILLNRVRKEFGYTEFEKIVDDGTTWRGMMFEGKLAVAFSDSCANGVWTVHNVCPVRGRYGQIGTYLVMQLYKTMVDSKVALGVCNVVPVNNKPMLRALARIFDPECDTKFFDEGVFPKGLNAFVFAYGSV
jgi:hypothetical protein